MQALELANFYFANACYASDLSVAMVLSHDTEVSLQQAKKVAKQSKNQAIHEQIATAYIELGRLLDSRGHGDEAQAFYKKADRLG
jgi:tetratricopeptide (TPR) repeat protein